MRFFEMIGCDKTDQFFLDFNILKRETRHSWIAKKRRKHILNAN